MRCGLPYYPKLQSCVPFTPVTGNRLLIKPGPNAAAVTKALAKGLLELTGVAGMSTAGPYCARHTVSAQPSSSAQDLLWQWLARPQAGPEMA